MNPPRIGLVVAASLLLLVARHASAQPRAVVVPASVDFGVVPPGSNNPLKLTITNSGNQLLAVATVTLEDPSAAFWYMGPPSLSVPAGQTVGLDLGFAPKLEGSFAATLVLTTNDPVARNIRIPINGIAALGSFSVTPPAALFPPTAVGGSAQALLTITNTSKLVLTLCAADLAGANANQFAINVPGKVSLQPGQSQSATISYQPTLPGPHIATVAITMCGLTTVKASLSGTAWVPDLSMATSRIDMAGPAAGQPDLASRGCSVGLAGSSAGPTATGMALLLALLLLGGARRRGVMALGVLAWSGCTQTPAARPAAGGDLKRAIHEGVVMIEARRDADFLDRFMIPYQRRQLYAGMTAEEQVAKFRRVAADKLLARLQAAERMEPTLNDSRTEATFALEPDLRLMRVDGQWRIAD